MGVTADIALPWTLFSTGLRALDTGAVGLSVFLLVSICVGDYRLGAFGACLPEAQRSGVESWQGGTVLPCRCSGEDVTRRQHTGRVTLKEGFVLRVVVRSFYYRPLGPFVVAVVD